MMKKRNRKPYGHAQIDINVFNRAREICKKNGVKLTWVATKGIEAVLKELETQTKEAGNGQ